jgi:hypothetical protein
MFNGCVVIAALAHLISFSLLIHVSALHGHHLPTTNSNPNKQGPYQHICIEGYIQQGAPVTQPQKGIFHSPS